MATMLHRSARAKNVGATRSETLAPAAIRDDGVLFPATPKILALQNMRPYYGDLKWDDNQRMQWLRGEMSKHNKLAAIEQDAFDIGSASAEDIIDFALNEYGQRLDPRKDLPVLRGELVAIVSEYQQAQKAA